jgi:hypothetical protein
MQKQKPGYNSASEKYILFLPEKAEIYRVMIRIVKLLCIVLISAVLVLPNIHCGNKYSVKSRNRMYKKIKRKKKKGKKCPCAQIFRMPGQNDIQDGTVRMYTFEVAGEGGKRG